MTSFTHTPFNSTTTRQLATDDGTDRVRWIKLHRQTGIAIVMFLQPRTWFWQNRYAWWFLVLIKLVVSLRITRGTSLFVYLICLSFSVWFKRFLGFDNHPLFVHGHVIFTSYLFLVVSVFVFIFRGYVPVSAFAEKKWKQIWHESIPSVSVFIPTYSHKQQLPTTQEGAQLVEVQSQTRAHLEQSQATETGETVNNNSTIWHQLHPLAQPPSSHCSAIYLPPFFIQGDPLSLERQWSESSDFLVHSSEVRKPSPVEHLNQLRCHFYPFQIGAQPSTLHA
jgi:hypothetical protein